MTNFWRLNRRERLGTQVCAVALWLLDLWNRNGRPDWFPCTLVYLCEETGVSRGTARRVLGVLEAQKLVEISKRGQKVPSMFSMIPMVKRLLPGERGQNVLSNCTLSEKRGQNVRSNGTLSPSPTIDARARSTTTTSTTSSSTTRGASNAREASSPPTKKPKLFISELKTQRDALSEHLNELAYRGYEDAFRVHYQPEDREKAKELKKRIKELRDEIANYGR